jgi:hypothetical protein
MTRLKRTFLTILALLPIPSVSFAAQETLSIDLPLLVQRGSRLADMYNAQYFSADFYQQMNALGIFRGEDLYKINDRETRQAVRDAVRKEMVELGYAGTPSPM